MNEIEKHEQIILMGHGSVNGLRGFGKFVIDESFGELLRYKDTTCIWCYAVLYCLEHRIQGLCTGMIVSEESEATGYNLPTDKELIDESNTMFSSAVREHLFKPNSAKLIKRDYKSETNPIIQFNRNNIFYR